MADSTRAPKFLAPIRTQMLEGVEANLTWPWMKYFDNVSAAIDSTTGGSGGGSGITGPQGPAGPQGVPGSQGPVGDPGADGATGLQGTTGLANFLMDATYPALGVPPVLLWNSTDEALYVGVTGVDHWVQTSSGSAQGLTGIQGATGPYGFTGLKGAQGDTGVIGQTGAQGYTGVLGATGLQGPGGGDQGNTGLQGMTGLANFWENTTYPLITVEPVLLWNGIDEALYAGVTGVDHWVQISAGSMSGATGAIGYTGAQGDTGVQGTTGLIGRTGIQGNTGVLGQTGLRGATGLQGSSGIQGTTGVQGVTGFKGDTGIQGIQGLRGNTGAQGNTGLTGPTGAYGGPQGSTGLQGPTGAQSVTTDGTNSTYTDGTYTQYNVPSAWGNIGDSSTGVSTTAKNVWYKIPIASRGDSTRYVFDSTNNNDGFTGSVPVAARSSLIVKPGGDGVYHISYGVTWSDTFASGSFANSDIFNSQVALFKDNTKFDGGMQILPPDIFGTVPIYFPVTQSLLATLGADSTLNLRVTNTTMANPSTLIYDFTNVTFSAFRIGR